jgi:flavin-dependent thymidylate synthase
MKAPYTIEPLKGPDGKILGPTINVVPRSFKILDPDMDPVTKIGTMARICYKSEPKDGADEAALNERVTGQCIKSGHTSVLEHGIFSVHLPIGPCADSTGFPEKLGEKRRINFRQVWEQRQNSVQAEFMIPFNDPDLETKQLKKLGIADNRIRGSIVPVVLADARAWREAIEAKVQAAIVMDEPYLFGTILLVVRALNKVAPSLFGDIVARLDQFIKDMAHLDGNKSAIASMMINKLEEKEWALEGCVHHFFQRPDDVYADAAASCASLSVIITADRAFTHQLVRHRRHVGYSQESQRYVNYNKKGYKTIAFTIDPNRANEDLNVDPLTGEVGEGPALKEWEQAMSDAFEHYDKLIQLGVPPESARGVLPNDCATTIGVTWMTPLGFNNLIHWRVDSHAQYAIRKLFCDILVEAVNMHHPFLGIVDCNLLKEWFNVMLTDGIYAEDNEKFNTARKNVDELVAAVQQMLAQQEETQKCLEEEAARAKEAAAAAERPRHIDLSRKDIVEPGNPADVKENPPTVQFLPKDAPTGVEVPPITSDKDVRPVAAPTPAELAETRGQTTPEAPAVP